MLDTAIKVTQKLEDNDIEYCLIGGSLLGAIRQKAFAGRPPKPQNPNYKIGVK
jgi:phosphorylcholine metabolism protein LicD